MMQKFVKKASAYVSDESFLKVLSRFEGSVAKVLSLAMVLVILVAVTELCFFLVQEIFSQPLGFSTITLIEIFGLFLNILIALEILENITAYLKKHVIQVELVIVTSLVAVARKIIILDFQKTTGIELIGLAIAIFALSVSYWIVRRVSPPRH
ncbi:MAG: phosphate-starvation-inducible PsiE family protein [Leptolyngbyaceae cyanobacterium bins.59]|nr:phosphate-starvation-inducible PsiE family protein [Leptolyngbyaceae cyanobacterium bins.59]